MLLKTERKKVVKFGKKLLASGLTQGTGGNISLSNQEKSQIAITPSGLEYQAIRPQDVSIIDFTGAQISGEYNPSSEYNFHLALQKLRGDIHAVVHTHSPYATTLACLGLNLPAVHYLIGFAGSMEVPCAPYASFGTNQLSENICKTINKGSAVLLENHGLVTVGANLETAFKLAEQIEFVARLYYQTKAIGEPKIINQEEMQEILPRFAKYTKQNRK